MSWKLIYKVLPQIKSKFVILNLFVVKTDKHPKDLPRQ